jgi:hypothetical protein
LESEERIAEDCPSGDQLEFEEFEKWCKDEHQFPVSSTDRVGFLGDLLVGKSTHLDAKAHPRHPFFGFNFQ